MTDLLAVVREARHADRDGIWPLARDFATSFAVDHVAFNAAFDELLADENNLLLVADQQSVGIIGYLLAFSHPTLFANGPVAWIEEVMVDERVRRAGIGRKLVLEAEEWASSAEAAYIALATRRADQFYEVLGYENSAVFFRKQLG